MEVSGYEDWLFPDVVDNCPHDTLRVKVSAASIVRLPLPRLRLAGLGVKTGYVRQRLKPKTDYYMS
jgi:hypothetical protein